jgi:hypothetical protein
MRSDLSSVPSPKGEGTLIEAGTCFREELVHAMGVESIELIVEGHYDSAHDAAQTGTDFNN